MDDEASLERFNRSAKKWVLKNESEQDFKQF